MAGRGVDQGSVGTGPVACWPGVPDEAELFARELEMAALEPTIVTAAERAEAEALFEAQLAMLGEGADPQDWWSLIDEDVEPRWGEGGPDAVRHGLGEAVEGAGAARRAAPDAAGRLVESDLVMALEQAGAALRSLQATAFVLVQEAVARGLHLEVGMGVHDWVRQRCPGVTPQLVSDLATSVRAAQGGGTGPLAEALAAGSVAPHRAARVARTLERLAPCLPADQQEAYALIATEAAANPEISDGDLGKVCHTLLVDLLEDARDASQADGVDSLAASSQHLRALTRRRVGPGLTRYTLDAPDGDAALLDGILSGPLAAPVPGPDGELDERSADQRRYDAFKTVLWRGLAEPGALPSKARASVLVTVRADHGGGGGGAGDGDGGRPSGAAFASTGGLLTAREAGELACLGEVTPVLLGERGEPIDLGRTERLASPAQFKALVVRDGSCTYPGCTIPSTWCDAHHLVWWSRGGATDLANLALLCPRHHTLVHARDLSASVQGATVTWHV